MMPFYGRWTLGSPLLISAISGATAVFASLVMVVCMVFTHVEKGLAPEHLVVLALYGVVCVAVGLSGLAQELRLGMLIAGRNGEGHAIDLRPASNAEVIGTILRPFDQRLTVNLRIMKWVRGLSHLLLVIGFIVAWWSHGGMYYRFGNELRTWEIIGLAVCWALYLPHAFMPMILHRQLALSGVCDWPQLPRWLSET